MKKITVKVPDNCVDCLYKQTITKHIDKDCHSMADRKITGAVCHLFRNCYTHPVKLKCKIKKDFSICKVYGDWSITSIQPYYKCQNNRERK